VGRRARWSSPSWLLGVCGRAYSAQVPPRDHASMRPCGTARQEQSRLLGSLDRARLSKRPSRAAQRARRLRRITDARISRFEAKSGAEDRNLSRPQNFFSGCGFESTWRLGAIVETSRRAIDTIGIRPFINLKQRRNAQFIGIFAYCRISSPMSSARMGRGVCTHLRMRPPVSPPEFESVPRTYFLKRSRCFFCSAVVIGVQCTSIRDCTVPISPLTRC